MYFGSLSTKLLPMCNSKTIFLNLAWNRQISNLVGATVHVSEGTLTAKQKLESQITLKQIMRMKTKEA